MWPYPQETADLVTFTEEILNGKLYFLCSVYWEYSWPKKYFVQTTFHNNLSRLLVILAVAQYTFTCSKSTIETLEKGVKC